MCLVGVDAAQSTDALSKFVVISDGAEEEGMAGRRDGVDLEAEPSSLVGAWAAAEGRGVTFLLVFPPLFWPSRYIACRTKSVSYPQAFTLVLSPPPLHPFI